MLRWFPAVAAGMILVVSTAAVAQPADLACDYYQNLLIGTLCKNTVDLGLGVSSDHREIDSSFAAPGFQATNKIRDTFVTESASASITPLSWLRVTIASSVAEQSNSFSQTGSFTGFGGGAQPFSFSSSSNQTYAGYQTLSGLANLLDTGPGSARYVINGFLTGGFVPGTDVGNTSSQPDAKWQTKYLAGIEANGRWKLPSSDYSIVARAGFTAAHAQLDDIAYAQPSLAVLLSNDAWGIAVGPSVYSNILVSRNNGVGSSPDSTFLGGAIDAQPFRMSAIAFLHNLTATVGVFHSLGQSSWIDQSNGNASELVVNAGLAWHFHY